MEKILSVIIGLAFLSGCVNTQQQAENTIANSAVVYTSEIVCHDPASNDETAADCSTADEGVTPVIHPVEEIPLPQLVGSSSEQNDDQLNITEENLWQYIANKLEFEVPDDQQRVDWQRDWYLKHPKYMQRVSNRATPFLYYIVKRLEEEDIPLDIALLPIVESAFDPFAYSHGRASGMWQFISGTGKRYGMKQTWWYDGRRDVIASTEGAIGYLKFLNKMFDGNWLHALAAYNSGEGRVLRAIKNNKRANKPTDFWSLSLPRETRAYVPKLLALADILKQHEKYGFAWPEIENTAVVDVVEVDRQIDLAKAATLANLTTAELQSLNPGFNRWATDPNGPHHLLLPVDRIEDFNLALADIPDNELLSWARHEIRSGDSLGVIANKYHTSVDVIKQVNNLRSNRIIAGEHLLVPIATQSLDTYALSVDQRIQTRQSKEFGKHSKDYIVKSGDTLWDIARANKVSIKEIAKWNGISHADPLKIGTKLVIWSDVPSQNSSGITRNIHYNVRSGDSLARIANKFNVKVNDIVKWNSLQGQKYLQPGQVLKLIVDITKT
ncbi:LysM peptidoglycan-binding domain-containing protein [Glaciecola sp. 1036]|uniref:LysM peptidoglycan-binding domain-containing protein n=1 Tax=Alteromonadaceae TaxID=72275 RepID=UPI003D008575